MGWTSNEEEIKKSSAISSKIIIAIIVCLALIVVLILVMLLVQINTYTLSVDNKIYENYDINKLIAKVDNSTYINIEEFSKLVGYEYHKGEFKSYTNGENKCYVQGKEETASFFLDDNKIYKLPIDKFDSEYRILTTNKPVIEIGEKMYAEIETINLAFNTSIHEKEKKFTVYTLDYLVKLYDKEVKKWGYTGIEDLGFENQKALIYNCLIVKKKDGLYKIINTTNTEEIVPDRYKTIEFLEANKEFNVTNSLDQVGIINIDGTTKIDPIYDEISVLDENLKLYLVEKDAKFGIVKSGNTTILLPEYDQIGLNNKDYESNQYFILDTLIPVCKNNKWGAFDKTGNLVYGIEYDGFGSDLTTVEIGGVKKTVKPLLAIERCKGVVVKKDNNYGMLDLEGNELVPIAVSNMYEIENSEDEDLRYFMLYNGAELNIIERLIKAGILKKEEDNQLNLIEGNELQANNINTTTNSTNIIQYNKNETIIMNNQES